MLNKIFLAILAIAVIITGIITFYSYTWLGSISAPQSAIEGYTFYSNLASSVIWISSIILLLVANAILWKFRRSWAMWASFAFFAVFILLRYFWLESAALDFQKVHNLTDKNFNFSPIFGIIFVVLAAIIVFFNQFINLRLNEKMYPPVVVETDPEIVEEA